MTDKKLKIMDPLGTEFDLENGVLLNPDEVLVRRASDMIGHYADEAALNQLIEEKDDPVHYEVFNVHIPEEYGHLVYCISKLQPGTVGGECFMTKGHYHTAAETAEVYLGLRGEGFMLMKTPDGRCDAQRMVRGRLVYVPPYWAHRSVNTGEAPLISLCVFPGEAGHNYGDIEEQGFPQRVYKVHGEVQIR